MVAPEQEKDDSSRPYKLYHALLHRWVIAKDEGEARERVVDSFENPRYPFELQLIEKPDQSHIDSNPDRLLAPPEIASYHWIDKPASDYGFDHALLTKLSRHNRLLQQVNEALAQPSTFPCVPELELSATRVLDFLNDVARREKFDSNTKHYFSLRYPKLLDVLLELHVYHNEYLNE